MLIGQRVLHGRGNSFGKLTSGLECLFLFEWASHFKVLERATMDLGGGAL